LISHKTPPCEEPANTGMAVRDSALTITASFVITLICRTTSSCPALFRKDRHFGPLLRPSGRAFPMPERRLALWRRLQGIASLHPGISPKPEWRKEAARIAMGKGICAPGRLHGGAGPLVTQCAVILTSVNCYESQGHCPELRQSGGEGSKYPRRAAPKAALRARTKVPSMRGFRPGHG